MGLVAACGRAATYVSCTILYHSMNCTTERILLYSGFGGLLVSLVASAFDPKHLILSTAISSMCLSTWLGIMTVAVLGVTAIFMVNKAIALSNPVLVSFVRVSDIVVSFVIQIIFLNQTPSLMGIVGSSFVLSAVSMLGFEKTFVSLLPEGIKQIF